MVEHTLAAELGRELLDRGWRVTAAESCTGGGIAAAITAVPGSSAWFEAGFVVYANRFKTELTGVRETTLEREGAVSEAVVREMAEGARSRLGADLAVAVSGIAGPEGGTPDKPVGTVWIAWAGPDGTLARHYHFSGDRDRVRHETVEQSLQGLIEQTRTTV